MEIVEVLLICIAGESNLIRLFYHVIHFFFKGKKPGIVVSHSLFSAPTGSFPPDGFLLKGKINLSFRLILFLGFFAGLIRPVGAVTPDKEPVKSVIETGILQTINNRFNQALNLYDQLIRQYPDHPVGYFYKGAVLQARMLDREDFSSKTEFYELMQKTIRLADSLQDSGSKDAWLYFYEGSALLYRSYLKTREANWFAAYRDAVRGVSRLESAIARDSLLYDAYLGVGSYKYWKSARTEFLSWLPFISDEREKGIAMIRQAIEKGVFVRWIGRDQLSWILMDDGQYRDALRIARENAQTFPESRFFKWTLASAALYCQELDIGYRVYGELLESIRQLPANNHYNEIDCLVSLAEIEVKRKNWQQAFRFADRALRLNISAEIRERARGKLKRALSIRNKCAEYVSR